MLRSWNPSICDPKSLEQYLRKTIVCLYVVLNEIGTPDTSGLSGNFHTVKALERGELAEGSLRFETMIPGFLA